MNKTTGGSETAMIDDNKPDMSRLSEPASQGGSSATMQGTGEHVMALKYEVTISNHSDETINSCRLRWLGALTDPPKDASGWKFDVAHNLGRVLPRDEISRLQTAPVRMNSDGALSHELTSELLFTDCAGVRWWRDAEHVLREGREDDPW